MKRLGPWLGALAILVIIFGTIYGVTQQIQRNDADWPQIQLAEDAALSLNNGASPSKLTANRVDMSRSLTPFVIIYDKSGKPVAGNGYISGHLAHAPLGILQTAQGKDFYRITWQPDNNVRIAAVTVQADHYYVLSGRNIKQVERNESESFKLAFIGGLLSLVVLASLYKVLYNKP